METQNVILLSILGIVLVVLLFLAFRELFCWYGKRNEQIHLQKRQLHMLAEIAKVLGAEIQAKPKKIPSKNEIVNKHLATTK